jgi:hypothetical protein
MQSPLAHLNPKRSTLHVVYFIPSDRQPEPNYRDRLDRVLTHVQQFYRNGMEQNGYGPLTFDLDRDGSGGLKIYEVQGRELMRGYDRTAYYKVREEVKEALAQQQIDIDRETLLIFQLLLHWNENKTEEIGPFAGCGDACSGTAWVYDDAKLDALLLNSCAAGGYYGNPCSLGQFNSHYIGGVAHELGHAFGLPHDCEQNCDRDRWGYSLMSRGNHSYGQESRGEGKGTFLSSASALPLSVHPLFTGKPKPSTGMHCQLVDVQLCSVEETLILTGQIQGSSEVIGLVAHNDPQAIPDDYDAIGWASFVDNNGLFHFRITDLKPGGYELRLTAYAKNGVRQPFAFRYSVKHTGQPDIRSFSAIDLP